MSFSMFAVFVFVLACAHLTHGVKNHCGNYSTINVAQGLVRGKRNFTAAGTEYYFFLGVPYASPPEGNLRFVAPQPHKRWSGVRDAFDFGSPCNQVNDSSMIDGDEDCLFVNVFTPKLPCRRRSTAALPVMVWIHGGAFVSGSGNIYPGHLLDRGVVIVSFNYRLNVFGFLSVEGTDATGNAGLKDQSFALRWVRRNIARFGGNPNRVTIFGESAGGASVHYHTLSPLSKGYFRRTISQSASALSPWAFKCRTQDRAFRLSYLVGKGANNTKDLVKNLRATPAIDLVAALSKVLTSEESKRLLSFPFMPTMEYHKLGEIPFLLQSPECIESNGSFSKVSYIIGSNVNEAALFSSEEVESKPSYWQNINDDLEQIVPLSLGLKKGSNVSLQVAKKIKEFYFGNESISYETRQRWVDLQSDLLFVLGVLTMVRSHARFSAKINTYNYQFVYHNASHTDELQYVFYSGKDDEGNSKSLIAEHFGSMWTSFAKIGTPNNDDDEDDEGDDEDDDEYDNDISWPSVDKDVFPYLRISTNLTVDKNLENDRINFWTNIYRNYRQSGRCCS